MIRVVGVGHALDGDDYIGIKVVKELSNEWIMMKLNL